MPKIQVQFILGDFQPVLRAQTEAVHAALGEAEKTFVAVRVNERRSPDAPFSFDEVREMWLAQFPDEPRLEIKRASEWQAPPEAKEIAWPLPTSIFKDDTEEVARAGLSITKPAYVCAMNWNVGEAIGKFATDWRQFIRSAWI